MTADKEALLDLLRRFAADVSDVKIKQKERIFAELTDHINGKDFPDTAIRGIIKMLLPYALFRYQDYAAQRLVSTLIKQLSANFREQTVGSISEIIVNTLGNIKATTLPYAKISLNGLKWLMIASSEIDPNKLDKPLVYQIADATSVCVSLVKAGRSKKLVDSAQRKLNKLFLKNPILLESLINGLFSKPEGFLQRHLCFVALAIDVWSTNRSDQILEKFTPTSVEFYVKIILSSKSKPDVFILESCKSILSRVNHDIFKQQLMPNVQKFLLRNPETVMEATTYLLEQVPIDLSSYALDLMKPLGAQLVAKDDAVRDFAALAIKHLAKQCSDQEVCLGLVNYLFRLLNGQVEGKLTTSSQRISVLSGIGNLSYHGASGSSAILSVGSKAIDLFIPLLKEEAHEATLIHALKMLSNWTGRMTNDAPASLTSWFLEALRAKSTTSTVAFAYLQCMNASYSSSSISAAKPLFDILSSTVDKATKQATVQTILLEALAATNLLLKLYPVVNDAETKFKPVFVAVIDKQLFASEKFILGLAEEEFLLLLAVAEKLLLEHADKISETNAKSFYRVLLIGLVHRFYKIRASAQSAVKKLLSSLSGVSISKNLLTEFGSMLHSGSLDKFAWNETADKSGPKDDTSQTNAIIPSKLLSEAVICLSRVPEIDERLANELIIKSLLLLANSRISNGKRDAWLDILKFYGREAGEFVKQHSAELIDQIWRFGDQAPLIARLVVQHADKSFYQALLSTLWQKLNNKDLFDVTVMDVDIMKTAEGVLYDRSVLQTKQDAPKTNIKRESKLYSYKEQLADIEMRKELEEKWRREGKLKDELTPKQKEAMQQQLAKEAEIRSRLLKLWQPAKQALGILEAIIEGNLLLAQLTVVEILEHVFTLFKSPLIADKSTKVWLAMGRACMPHDKNLSMALAFVTFRMAKFAAPLDTSWTQEPLDVMICRVLGLFYAKQNAKAQANGISNEENVQNEPPSKVLNSAAIAYCFPLVQLAFEERRALYKNGEGLPAVIIDCIAFNIGTAGWDNKNFNVTCLPFENIISLMINLIGNSDAGQVQQSACNCLLENSLTIKKFAKDLNSDAVGKVIRIVLNGLFQPSGLVREYSLKALDNLCDILTEIEDTTIDMVLTQRLFVASFDPEEGNQILAKNLWDKLQCSIELQLCEHLVDDVIHHTEAVREAASSAVCAALEKHKEAIPDVLNKLCGLYVEKLDFPPPIYDDFGRLISEGGVDEWEARAGIALTLQKMCPLLSEKDIMEYFAILLPDGLNDRSAEVRNLMLSAAIAGVKDHGEQQISRLLPMFEKQLDELPDEKKYDILRQSLAVLLGTLAQHLKKEDPKVRPIVAKLIEVLSTPSQQVQEAVANCLPPLVPAIKEQVPQIIEKLLCLLLDAEQYGERRGAAYGIAGLVKGMGILSLKQFEIMTKLNAAISDKKNARHREGALLAIEMLCNMLGKLFEPYVVHILPNLLLCFGDIDQHVREAADDCAKAVMRHLSAHGVKLVLPSLLSGLEEDSWRTKCGSVELLAAMSYCAPKQLSSCLPSIVPKLIEVLSDTHIRVQKSGEHALRQIGKVVKNPEIQAVVNILLAALEDPANKTSACLQTLLHTKFVHYIDAPSLALIMPVIYRAFDDRSTETRKMAAQIVGNIYSLTDQKDVEPYLPKIMPGLKKCLLDPVPEVRAVAARALGAMVRATGESCFDDLVPWLQQTLITPAGSVDRSGAAQGLSEVIGGLGEQHLARVMPEIIQAAESTDVEPHVRDGYILMYTYLPTVFGDRFLPYVTKIIPSCLKALADENEYVRETALRAGQRIITTYCETAIPLLLPSLERGLFDDNWRIRFSSVQLLGDLLFKVSGVTGKMTTESGEDDTFGTESANKAVTQALGIERRNRVLAGLYIARSDVALMCRQAASHVWKVVVSNTPRTLKEILQDLFILLLGCLASSNYEKQQVASRSLGELVRKMGERILVDVVPVLEQGLQSAQPDQRRGVCIALSAIVANISKDMVLMYAENLIPTAKQALCDPLPEVREAAASTFSTLHNAIGTQAMDEILTPLLDKLDDPENGHYILDGLRRVLALKSKVFLPYVIPKLTAPPVNTKALAQLASVAGESLNKYLNKILSALLSLFASKLRTPEEEQELHNCTTVISAVSDETGVAIVVDLLLQKTSENDLSMKQAASTLLAYFCQNTTESLANYIPQLVRGLIILFAVDDDVVINSSTEALNALIKDMDSKERMDLVPIIRIGVKSAVELSPVSSLPGFRRDKTLQPVLTILREGVLNGSPDTKEVAAQGLSETVSVSDPAALKPHVVNITGPLIRILGDRYPPNIKTALLSCLALLLSRVGVALKAFLPQLQSTFVKALNEPASKTVRLKAGQALAELAKIHPKADTLTADVCKNAKAAEDNNLKETYLLTMRLLICAIGPNLTSETKSMAELVTISLIGAGDEASRIASGAALGALIAHCLTDEEAEPVLRKNLLSTDANLDWTIRHGNSIALQVALKENVNKFDNRHEIVIKALLTYISSDRVPISSAGLRAAGYYLCHQLNKGNLDQQLATGVARSINHQATDVKLLSAIVLDYVAQRSELDNGQLKLFIPSMVNGTKERNSAVRSACEEALVNLLKLRRNTSVYESYLETIDAGARESLVDVYSKALQKLAKQQQELMIKELDDTVQVSEEMCLCQLFLQSESAYSIICQLGELGVAHFRDLNPAVNAFQRKYVDEIRQCDDMERKLRYIESEIKRENIFIPQNNDTSNGAPQQRELLDLKATLNKVESEIREVNTNTKALKKSNMELVELSHVLRVVGQYYDEGMGLSEHKIVSMMSPADEESGQRPPLPSETSRGAGLTCVTGLVDREKVRSFERMIWRCSRGNVYFRNMDIGQIENPDTGQLVNKCVFIMFFAGSQLETKTSKICDAFHATIYPCPENSQERHEMTVGLMNRLSEYETVLGQSNEHRTRLLTAASKHLNLWEMNIRKVKAVYHTMNFLNLDVTRKCLIAECWIPLRDLEMARKALEQGGTDSGTTVTSILNRLDSDEIPPTYFKTNKFTGGFQSIVDAYGMASYREVNPTPFTIITFPFLFAIMFGDVGHGLLMAAFAAFLCIHEKKLEAAKIRDEIFSTFFGGRYIILLMGIFGVYTGTIYNDMFSKSINVFGSTWRIPYSNYTLAIHDKLEIDPTSTAFLGLPYPYGFDPVWSMSSNKLNFMNTFKMKMSVILGILQMLLGVCLSFMNYKYFKSPLDIFCQFLPQLIFLVCIFVYLCCMIMYKWIVFPAGPAQMAVGLYPGSHCAPSLLIGLINMFMLKNRPQGFEGPTCPTNAYYPHQVTVETVLVLIALVCVPWMLLSKPFILKWKHKRKKPHNDIQLTILTHDGDVPEPNSSSYQVLNHTELTSNGKAGGAHRQSNDHGHAGHGEEFSFGEVFIHQAIHTIEYCLGCISHTASYLRLWALSLAHAELSEVLWKMVMKNAFSSTNYVGVPLTYAIFFAFGCLTLAILVIMEGLSAFLHALRLHWVEFQSKFYAGSGYMFEPFSFKRILESDMDEIESSYS